MVGIDRVLCDAYVVFREQAGQHARVDRLKRTHRKLEARGAVGGEVERLASRRRPAAAVVEAEERATVTEVAHAEHVVSDPAGPRARDPARPRG